MCCRSSAHYSMEIALTVIAISVMHLAVNMQAPALTVLMPLDSLGVCGHGSCSLAVPPHGCTRQQLLHSIYSFYQVSSVL